MHFIVKPEEKKVELKNDKREIVKVAVLLPAYPIAFLYKEKDNTIKKHVLEYSAKDSCIYFNDSKIEEDTVVDITEDKNVQEFVFLEDFEFEKFEH